MEEPNSEDAKGYGRGLIEVTPVTIDEFNANPMAYLKDSKGKYKYDVVYLGHWDENAKKGLSKNGVNAIEEFIKTGRGVLLRT